MRKNKEINKKTSTESFLDKHCRDKTKLAFYLEGLEGRERAIYGIIHTFDNFTILVETDSFNKFDNEATKALLFKHSIVAIVAPYDAMS